MLLLEHTKVELQLTADVTRLHTALEAANETIAKLNHGIGTYVCLRVHQPVSKGLHPRRCADKLVQDVKAKTDGHSYIMQAALSNMQAAVSGAVCQCVGWGVVADRLLSLCVVVIRAA